MWKRYHCLQKVYKRVTFSVKYGIKKGKVLDLGEEPPRQHKTLLSASEGLVLAFFWHTIKREQKPLQWALEEN